MIKNEIINMAKVLQKELIDIRRTLHKNPELSLKEFNTSKYIYEKLKEHGIDEVYNDIYETTVMAIIRGEQEGNTILLRADMDGLPIEELNDIAYKSCNRGVMHGCGHDGHMTWILGAAIILNKLKKHIKGNIKVLFQPAEEGIGGADALLKQRDILNEEPKVNCAIGTHVWPSIESGQIGIVDGCAMAAANKFTIEIMGKGGHGAEPHNSIDPIALGNQVYMSLQQIISRKTNPYEGAVLTIGVFKGEGSYNVIPDKVIMEGTVRGESYDAVVSVMAMMNSIIKGIVESQGGKFILHSEKEIHAVHNDHKLVIYANEILQEILPKQCIHILKHGSMTGEDFCYISNRIPSLFMYIGTRNESKKIIESLHNPKFNLDEDILSSTSAYIAYLTYKYLKDN